MTENLAPIVLFVYNRPQHTKRTIEALANNELASDSDLIIYADGPKFNASEEELRNINMVRTLFENQTLQFKSVKLIKSDSNIGLASSIHRGVTAVLNQYENIIVLEDDLVTFQGFLRFMNEALYVYKDKSNVYSVNGYMFPVDFDVNKSVLLPYTSTWGWGTWRSRWTIFDNDMSLKETIKSNDFIKSRFDLANYSYVDMLDFKNNSWGIKWYYSVFVRGGLGVFPTFSLLDNIGNDGSGENKSECNYLLTANANYVTVVEEDVIDLRFWSEYLNYFSNVNDMKTKNKSLVKRLFNKLLVWLRKF